MVEPNSPFKGGRATYFLIFSIPLETELFSGPRYVTELISLPIYPINKTDRVAAAIYTQTSSQEAAQFCK
jgi:hypothetical protein